MSQIQIKDPGDSIEFGMEWEGLGALTLASVVHTVPSGSGLTVVQESTDTVNGTSAVRLSGGAHGKLYQITGTATLSNGRTLVRSFPLRLCKI